MISDRPAGNRVSENRSYLVVADVIVALIHAFPIRPMRERFCDVLDIWDSIHEGAHRPASVTRGNSVQINWAGALLETSPFFPRIWLVDQKQEVVTHPSSRCTDTDFRMRSPNNV